MRTNRTIGEKWRERGVWGAGPRSGSEAPLLGGVAIVSRWLRSAAEAPRARTLSHPLFLVSLALLLLNDHVWKGGGTLPGAITGKLSDFAGLVVAPVLLVACLPRRVARIRWARFAALGAVGAGFIAVKLSAAAAAIAIGAMGKLGVGWKIWQDPTDLFALVSLLPAYWLVSRRDGAAPGQGQLRYRMSEMAIGAVALLACVATSAPPNDGAGTTAYVVNLTEAPITVHARWIEGRVECEWLGDGTRLTDRKGFDTGVTKELAPRETLALRRSVSSFDGGGGFSPPSEFGGFGGSGSDTDPPKPVQNASCDVVLLEIDGMAPTVVWWKDLAINFVLSDTSLSDTFLTDEALIPGRISITSRDPVKLEFPGVVQSGEAKDFVPPSVCAGADQSTFAWSAPAINAGVIEAIDTLPGGCLDVSLTSEIPPDPGTGGAGGMGGSPSTGGAGGMGGSPSTGGAGGMGGSPSTGGAGGMGGSPSTGGASGMGGSPVVESPDDGDHLLLCMPAEDFPFIVGDTILLTEDLDPDLGASLRIEKDTFGPPTLRIVRRSLGFSEGGLVVSVGASACEGDRLPCGGYASTADVKVDFGAGPTTVGPGEIVEGPGSRVRVGRAEHVIFATTTCGDGRDQLGVSMDFLWVVE